MKSKMPARPRPPLPYLRWRWMLPVLGAVTCLPAFAADDRVFRPYVGYSFAYDENVSGIPNGANQNNEKLSNTSHRTEAGLAINKRISQQVLSAKLNVSRVAYDRLGTLNNKDILGNWNWHVGDHVEGNLGASYLQALSPYANVDGVININERNLRTQRREFADGSWLLHPSWRLRGGVSRDKLAYDLPSQKPGDRNELTSEFGLDYLAHSGSTVGVQLRHTRGDLPNPQLIGLQQVDNSYDQNEIKAKVNWLLTGKTQLQFLGGYVQRKHDFFPVRDFSGLNARMVANWKPTGKIGVTVSGWREIGALDNLTVGYTLSPGEIGAADNLTASYTLNQGLSVGSTWDWTSKLRLDGQLKHETSDYRGAAGSAPSADRKDTFRTASLKLTYRPTDHLQLAVLGHRKIRGSNLDGNSYSDNGVMLSSRYEF